LKSGSVLVAAAGSVVADLVATGSLAVTGAVAATGEADVTGEVTTGSFVTGSVTVGSVVAGSGVVGVGSVSTPPLMDSAAGSDAGSDVVVCALALPNSTSDMMTTAPNNKRDLCHCRLIFI
jgi:hypothetical protein